jgi:hypothetical protein
MRVAVLMVVRVRVLRLGHLHERVFHSGLEIPTAKWYFEAVKVFAMFSSVLVRLLWILSRNIP